MLRHRFGMQIASSFQLVLLVLVTCYFFSSPVKWRRPALLLHSGEHWQVVILIGIVQGRCQKLVAGSGVAPGFPESDMKGYSAVQRRIPLRIGFKR